MKLQDRYPYDKALYGLNGIFTPVGINSFYVNSNCILANKKIITNGKSYLIASASDEISEVIVREVTLMDVLFNKGFLFLFVLELKSNKNYILNLPIDCPDKNCDWVLSELNDRAKLEDYMAIRSFCDKCVDTHKKGVFEDRPNENHDDDLLEFEY